MENLKKLLHTDVKELEIDLSGKSLLECSTEFLKYKSKMLGIDAKKRYGPMLKHFRMIEEECDIVLMPHHITEDFWCEFVEDLIKREYKPSYIECLYAQTKTLLDWCAKHKAIVSETYTNFKRLTYRINRISLSADEVSWCYHFDLSKIERRPQLKRTLEMVRDMFVLSCNLGQRHSDMIRISPENFSRNIFTIMQLKTGNIARVDMDRLAIDKRTTYAILEKYNYTAPYKSDISHYARHLKTLFRLMGMNYEVSNEYKHNGELKKEKVRVCDVISPHDSRRTFATINYYRDLPKRELMEATGHTTEESFNEYIVKMAV